MRDFNFGDDDNDMDDYEQFNEDGFVGEFMLPLVQGNSKFELLDYSFRICENSIFWKFLPADKKIERILETYASLKEIFIDLD